MSELIGERQFREKPDISQVFIRHLDRTNHIAALDFETSVGITLATLPEHWRNWVYQNAAQYQNTELTLVYLKNCGKRMGRADAPLLEDERTPVRRLDDGSIDWSDPNIISPTLQEVTTVDHVKKYEIVMTAAQKAGLTWSIDPLEQDAGDTEEYIVERKKTPFRRPRIPDTEGEG